MVVSPMSFFKKTGQMPVLLLSGLVFRQAAVDSREGFGLSEQG